MINNIAKGTRQVTGYPYLLRTEGFLEHKTHSAKTKSLGQNRMADHSR